LRIVYAALLLCALAAGFAMAAPRGPIEIFSDEEFTLGNGVVGGAGTTDDPYLISGWEIAVPSGSEHGIYIRGTISPFVIEGCRISGAVAAAGAAILLENVHGGRVENTTFLTNTTGLHVVSSQHIVARGNVHVGSRISVLVEGGSGNIEIDQGYFYAATYGVQVRDTHRVMVRACAMMNLEVAVTVGPTARNTTVQDCTIVAVGAGLTISSSDGRFTGNLISRADTAILLPDQSVQAGPSGNRIHRNLIYRAAAGVYLGPGTRENWIYENLFWDVARAGHDHGHNNWASLGRGNWYSDYTGRDANGDGIGDPPVDLGNGSVDPAPLMEREFLGPTAGVLGTLSRRQIVLEGADGAIAPLEVLVLDRAHARSIGLQGLPPEMAGELALLFVYDREDTRSFHMQNVFLALELIYFATDGSFVGRQIMYPEAAVRYTTVGSAQFVLEVPPNVLEQFGLLEPARLVW